MKPKLADETVDSALSANA